MSLKTDRTLGFRFAITRPKVIVPLLLALGFSGAEGLWWLALGFALLGVFRAYQILSYDDLVDRLRLREHKRQCGITRRLSPQECIEVLRIDRYAQALRDSGADVKLGEDVLERMWIRVKDKGLNDAAGELREFRMTLPTLPAPYSEKHKDLDRNAGQPEQDLTSRIQQELDLMRAAHIEVEAI